MIRDAFINGLHTNIIRQYLLENKVLGLSSAFDQARSLDAAQKNSLIHFNKKLKNKKEFQKKSEANNFCYFLNLLVTF